MTPSGPHSGTDRFSSVLPRTAPIDLTPLAKSVGFTCTVHITKAAFDAALRTIRSAVELRAAEWTIREHPHSCMARVLDALAEAYDHAEDDPTDVWLAVEVARVDQPGPRVVESFVAATRREASGATYVIIRRANGMEDDGAFERARPL